MNFPEVKMIPPGKPGILLTMPQFHTGVVAEYRLSLDEAKELVAKLQAAISEAKPWGS